MIKVLEAFYSSPQFRIKDREGESDYRKQRTGIRQGCPLSPYLFIIVMTVLISDIRQELFTFRQREPIDGIGFADVLYADDTLLFGTHKQY